jgi:tetratricopeptide (TPR) repeat protein
MRAPLEVEPGDIIIHQNKGGSWDAVKILELDRFPEGSPTAHCLTYQPLADRPALAALGGQPVRIWHAPVAAASFGTGWERIGRQAVTMPELAGFIEYLKLTDFPRYIQVSGLDVNALVGQANKHYQRAYSLGTAGKHSEAISEYSAAIDLFPLFYEAIDNRAFTYMDLGRNEKALADFEASLRVNPDGAAAFFSKGECLFKLGRLAEAEAIFSAGIPRFPEHHANFTKFLALVRKQLKSR